MSRFAPPQSAESTERLRAVAARVRRSPVPSEPGDFVTIEDGTAWFCRADGHAYMWMDADSYEALRTELERRQQD
jgi:hypothetical protein